MVGIFNKKPYYKRLEEKFAEYHRFSYGVSCNTGFSALILAIRALEIGVGDEVICPEFTMIATAWAISHCGAKPVFVDCDDNLNIDYIKIEEKITNKTKAIMITDIYGRRCNYAVKLIAKKYNLLIIEDACEAHGLRRPIGDIICYSFYQNKIVSAEEGGMCLTNNLELRDRMNILKNMAFGSNERYLHKEIAYNFRMPESQAKLALKSLSKIDRNLKKRKKIENWYNKYLKKEFQMPEREVVWVYDIISIKKNRLLDYLNQRGIQARSFFAPMSIQPMYLGKYNNLKAFDFFNNGLYLPVNPDMTKQQVKKICILINNFV